MGMLYAAIDIHKRVFQAAVLDPASGEIAEAPPRTCRSRDWSPRLGVRRSCDKVAIRSRRSARFTSSISRNHEKR